MDLQSSDYQAFKLWLSGVLPIDRDILHVLIGLLLVGIAVLWCRKGVRLAPFVAALGGALVLGVGMELLDMRDDIQTLGRWRWQASLWDVARTILIPAIAVMVVAWKMRRVG